MTERLETILVGFGSIGESLSSDPCMRQHFDAITHADVLQEHPAFNFAAVVDPLLEAQQKAKKVWNVPQAFADVKDAVSSVSPETLFRLISYVSRLILPDKLIGLISILCCLGIKKRE